MAEASKEMPRRLRALDAHGPMRWDVGRSGSDPAREPTRSRTDVCDDLARQVQLVEKSIAQHAVGVFRADQPVVILGSRLVYGGLVVGVRHRGLLTVEERDLVAVHAA